MGALSKSTYAPPFYLNKKVHNPDKSLQRIRIPGGDNIEVRAEILEGRLIQSLKDCKKAENKYTKISFQHAEAVMNFQKVVNENKELKKRKEELEKLVKRLNEFSRFEIMEL